MKDRYLKLVYWSEDDQCYVGACPDLMLGGVHGDDEIEVYRELCDVVGEWITIQEADGEPLPPATTSHEHALRIADPSRARSDAPTSGI